MFEMNAEKSLDIAEERLEITYNICCFVFYMMYPACLIFFYEATSSHNTSPVSAGLKNCLLQ